MSTGKMKLKQRMLTACLVSVFLLLVCGIYNSQKGIFRVFRSTDENYFLLSKSNFEREKQTKLQDLYKNLSVLHSKPPSQVFFSKHPNAAIILKRGIPTHRINQELKRPINKTADSRTYFIKIINHVEKQKVKSQILREMQETGPTIAKILGVKYKPNLTTWEKFHLSISQKELYSAQDPTIDGLIQDMATLPVIDASMIEGGTQLKLIIKLSNECNTLFKPMRFTREQETNPNHFYFNDYERHNSEIASFHLDRILGFRRAPPVVGRIINVTNDIYQFADKDLAKTFFISPANNICFFGKCSYYCDSGHAICAKKDVLEGSFAAFLPSKSLAPRKLWRHPWRRSYHKWKLAVWEVSNNYCSSVRRSSPYNSGRLLLDIMDMSIFDFLTGNMDRHHFETFKFFGNNTFPLHLDQGRGFGKPKHDEISILAPLYQCCLIRFSTVQRLMDFYTGPYKLSELMHESLTKDPVIPILIDGHFIALDRRVEIILKTVKRCIDKLGLSKVIIDDHL